ncbi:uncharacterized protein [Lepisosteus oculatus]|uniref:uncharacterized protein n=1 Tax=Lepisosteus oculatus TaxID=7918 RepID=UPI003722D6D5
MELLRSYFWLWVTLGMVFVSIFLCFLFFLINKCIAKKEPTFFKPDPQPNNYYARSSQYHPKDLGEELPPLPPRVLDFPSCPSAVSHFSDCSMEKVTKCPEDTEKVPDYVKVVATPPLTERKEVAVAMAVPVPVPPCAPECQDSEEYDDVVSPGYVSEDYDDVV